MGEDVYGVSQFNFFIGTKVGARKEFVCETKDLLVHLVSCEIRVLNTIEFLEFFPVERTEASEASSSYLVPIPLSLFSIFC